MAKTTNGTPQETSARSWKPLKYDLAIARSSVRLRFVKLFPSDAKSWDEREQLKKPLSDQLISNQIGIYENNFGPGLIAIARLWGNPYGVPNVAKPRSDQAKLFLAYTETVFKPVIGEAALAVQAEMANFIQHVGPKATASVQLNKFRNHYEGLVEELRKSEPDGPDACAMIAHYDQWVSYLVDLVNDGSGNARHLRPDDKLEHLVNRALKSAAALRLATKDQEGSPIVDLHNFYSLTNELQSHCTNVALQKPEYSELSENSKSILAKESLEYFGMLDRFLQIVGNRRVDEALHGLVVATTLNLEKRMQQYGRHMVDAMRQILVARFPQEPDWRHPVLLMTASLFQGDPPPIELPQLESYFKNGHHASVLANVFNMKPEAFYLPIMTALNEARLKWH